MTPLPPCVTLVSSLEFAHQFLRSTSPEPRAGEYGISKTQPFLIAVRTRVCLKKKGRRGPVRGILIIWAVSEEGEECFKHATEKFDCVVGCSERIS